MLDKQPDKINSRKGLSDERIVFMFIVVESHIVAVIGINPGKGDDRAPKITADIFNNGFGVTEVRLGINIKAIFILTVYFRFCHFKGRADPFFQFIQKDSLERPAEVGIIEVSDGTPETVIGIPAFGKEAVDMGVPFERAPEGMEDADKAGNKVF